MEYLISGIIGYLLGTVNFAYLIGKKKGFDIRTRGSTNAGASNATITMGWKIGIIVALLDISKAVLSVIISRAIFPDIQLAGIITGVSCVVGHMFPFYMRFRGGKGFACYVGMILVLNWKFGLIIIASAVLITVISDYIALATISTVTVYPIYLLIISAGWIPAVLAAVASVLIIIKHLTNIRKIIKGEEVGLRKVYKEA